MDATQYPFSKFEYINIPYPFYCIKPLISNAKKDTGRHLKGLNFILKPDFQWRGDLTSITDRRDYLIKRAVREMCLELSETGEEIDKDNILKYTGKIIAGGVKV